MGDTTTKGLYSLVCAECNSNSKKFGLASNSRATAFNFDPTPGTTISSLGCPLDTVVYSDPANCILKLTAFQYYCSCAAGAGLAGT